MAYTYVLNHPDPAIAKVSRFRFELGDTVLGAGIKPDGTNFTDEELQIWLDDADGIITDAIPVAAATLARMWTTVADITVGPRTEKLSQVAAAWASRASSGSEGVTGGSGAFAVGVTRSDGYSANAEYS